MHSGHTERTLTLGVANGDFGESRAVIRRRVTASRVKGAGARALNPLSAIINFNLGGTVESVGRFAEADVYYRKVISKGPHSLAPASVQEVGTCWYVRFGSF